MIKVCQFSRYFEEIVEALEKNNIEYSSHECLGRCDLCMKVPFVRREHEFITGENISDLIRKLV